jgi:uncharacterized protein YkwD
MRPTISVAAVGFLLALAFAATSAVARPHMGGATATSPSEQALLAEVNRVRGAYGLPALRTDGRLVRAARAHTHGMLQKNRFAHGNLTARLRQFGVRAGRVGENLAWGSGSLASAQAIVRMWLNSPAHRANLLRPGFRKIGLGTGFGSFAGYDLAIVVTANFQGT